MSKFITTFKNGKRNDMFTIEEFNELDMCDDLADLADLPENVQAAMSDFVDDETEFLLARYGIEL